MVRVLTVDDNAPFLDVLRELMSATPGFESAGEAGSGAEGLAAVAAAEPDLVLVDVHMPDMSGIDVARRLSAAIDPPIVVLITAQDLTQLPAATRSCGAAEVISKQELGPATLRRLWNNYGSS